VAQKMVVSVLGKVGQKMVVSVLGKVVSVLGKVGGVCFGKKWAFTNSELINKNL